MTETQLRFLRAIADRVPLDRLAEVHLFPAMRQGITETGIAVVAARQEPPAPAASETAPPAAGAPDEPPSQVELALVDDPIGEPGGDPTEAASVNAASTQPPDEVPDDSPAADAHEGDVVGSAVGRIEPARGRHTVFSARYRLTLKGPERGRWEADVVEEADAPLLTVEMVVRGVQRRSGEGADPERLDAVRLRELLAPATSA